MARPKKQGIDYFPFDVGFFSDVKIRKIIRGCGVSSTPILICLLCNVYKDNGYYILWDEDLPFVIADTVGVSEGAVKEVMLKALQVGFFDQSLYEKYQILTSKGIQSRFKAAVYKREEIEYIADYLVSDVQNSITVIQNVVNDTGSTQSKVKVKRKKNNTPTPPKGGRRGKKSEPKEINSKARFLFEQHFKNTFSNDYYWTPKDAGNMSNLINKLTFLRKQKGMSVDDESVLYALRVFLSSIKDGWVFEHFSVANINSQFNEIVAKAQMKNVGTSKKANFTNHDNSKRYEDF